MTQISRTGIEGFDFTWNPVIGCLRGCPYCWARKCVKRFASNLAKKEYAHIFNRKQAKIWEKELLSKLLKFEPVWLESKFKEAFPQKPSRIVVGWMSDIAYWKQGWVEDVLAKIRQYPQHQFFFLTKDGTVYKNWEVTENCWLGVTSIGNTYEITYRHRFQKIFLSLEPLLQDPRELFLNSNFSWVIIGAETGRRKDKVIPKREWVEAIINQAKEAKVPVYIKDNLSKIYPEFKGIKEIPE